jgi:hypothetical protein
MARERLPEGLRPREDRPRRNSRSACLRVRSDVLPRAGTANGTPARRALDRPIRDCLLRGPGSVFPLAHVMHFFAHKFSGLRTQ